MPRIIRGVYPRLRLSASQDVVTDCVLFMWPLLLNGHGESTGIDVFFNNLF
jgi:hypothetical protein